MCLDCVSLQYLPSLFDTQILGPCIYAARKQVSCQLPPLASENLLPPRIARISCFEYESVIQKCRVSKCKFSISLLLLTWSRMIERLAIPDQPPPLFFAIILILAAKAGRKSPWKHFV